MKATESPLANLLKGPRQFLIPIYQRAYSWSEEQCAQLWEDVLRVAEDDRYPAHFIGSVVYIEHGIYQATTIPQLLVIDGQQRLTTVTLMIEALARALEARETAEPSEITSRKLRAYFLFNPEEDGELHYKLQLSQGDTPTLRAILEGKPLPEDPARLLVDNFEFFRERIEESDVEPETLYRGLSKLLVVDVALDRDHDNPQLIFESLNSTGLDLSQSDLIRNFVLMGLEPKEQNELYKDHWRPMERVLAHSDRDDCFDRFLRAWLTLRLGEVPNIRRGYETFKRYRADHSEESIEDLVADLHRNAEYYSCIALGRETHPALQRVFRGLKTLRIDAPMPFLLYAYGLWKDGTLPKDDMIEIARLMECWLFRRAVCDIPSNVLSRTFATLPDQVEEEKLLESLSAHLLLRPGKQRFPKDEEFRAALISRNLYEFKHRQYCLERLENHERKEPVEVSAYTIEHVLPQNENLAPEWRAMLGADWARVQEQWLHTLGNLTLTGYNPELSDRPFSEKQTLVGGFQDSPLRLNRSLAKTQEWNETAIQARGHALASKATEVWAAPKIAESTLDGYRAQVGTKKRKNQPRVSLAHFGLTPETRELYDQLAEGAEALDLEPTIWRHWVGFGRPGAGKPYPVMVFPRKGWLRIQLRIPYDELSPPPKNSYRHEVRRGSVRTMLEIRSAEEVGQCLDLIPQVPMLAMGDLGDAPDDEDSGVDS